MSLALEAVIRSRSCDERSRLFYEGGGLSLENSINMLTAIILVSEQKKTNVKVNLDVNYIKFVKIGETYSKTRVKSC